MKRNLFVLLTLAIAALFAHGCDDVCTESVTVIGTMDAELYYPCDGSGPFPATTMTSGYLGTDEQVEWLAQDVAESGYVVLAMTPLNPLGVVNDWEIAHVAGVRKLQDLNNSGVLRGKIDINRLQTCGHSKGGGGALRAAHELGSEVKTAIGMAPWQGDTLNLSGITAATLIQAGSLDTLATSVITGTLYGLLPDDISKAYFMYPTADHLSWASMGTNHSIISRDVVAWMDYYLKGDTSARDTLSSASGKVINEWEDKSDDGEDPIGCD